MQIDIKNANFKFYKWTCPFKLSDLEKELEKIKADLKEGGQDGFVLPDLSEDGQVVISKYHAAVGKDCGKLKKYLQHERLKHKAMFSAVISVINPEKSTSVMNELLLLHDWENKDVIKKHFKLLEEV